jgi:hypothetical protein
MLTQMLIQLTDPLPERQMLIRNLGWGTRRQEFLQKPLYKNYPSIRETTKNF